MLREKCLNKKVVRTKCSFDKEFTERHYRKLIQLAKENFEMVSFGAAKARKRLILLRHDIDYSVHRACRLAKIEKEEGVISTFFLLPGSFFYNIFEAEIRILVTEIIENGHHIGLHFDPTTYLISSKYDLEQWLTFEKNILESLFNVEIKVFSFHNPSGNILKYADFKYSEMINTYASYFQKNMGYCSDSNGYWRHDRLEDILRQQKYNKLHILIHPEWWQDKPVPPRERIKRCIDGRARKQLNLYDKILKDHGRLNID